MANELTDFEEITERTDLNIGDVLEVRPWEMTDYSEHTKELLRGKLIELRQDTMVINPGFSRGNIEVDLLMDLRVRRVESAEPLTLTELTNAVRAVANSLPSLPLHDQSLKIIARRLHDRNVRVI